jgi:hypothetical protein
LSARPSNNAWAFLKKAIMTFSILSSVKQFTRKHPAFTTGGTRSLIFNEHTNGLADSGAILRIGRKVLINEDKFFSWIESQNTSGAK